MTESLTWYEKQYRSLSFISYKWLYSTFFFNVWMVIDHFLLVLKDSNLLASYGTDVYLIIIVWFIYFFMEGMIVQGSFRILYRGWVDQKESSVTNWLTLCSRSPASYKWVKGDWWKQGSRSVFEINLRPISFAHWFYSDSFVLAEMDLWSNVDQAIVEVKAPRQRGACKHTICWPPPRNQPRY